MKYAIIALVAVVVFVLGMRRWVRKIDAERPRGIGGGGRTEPYRSNLK